MLIARKPIPALRTQTQTTPKQIRPITILALTTPMQIPPISIPVLTTLMQIPQIRMQTLIQTVVSAIMALLQIPVTSSHVVYRKIALLRHRELY